MDKSEQIKAKWTNSYTFSEQLKAKWTNSYTFSEQIKAKWTNSYTFSEQINAKWTNFYAISEQTRTVRGSDYSPAIEQSEQKDILVTAIGDTEKYSEKQANKVWLNSVYWFSRY